VKFTVTGADRQTGRDAELTLVAASAQEAERLATSKGMLVANVKAMGMATDISTDPLPIWDEDPTHPPPAITRNPPSQGSSKPPASAPAAAPALSTTMVDANHEQDAAHAQRAAQLHAQQAGAPASGNYHVIQNPALYLLESAVNKHIKEGWEPLGGIQVNNWNNQMQFFQSLIRRNPGPG
jgi:hypothetical protein